MRAILDKNSRKDKIITIRCTEKERSMLERKANQQQKSLSEYMLDSGMAGVERRRNRDRQIEEAMEGDGKLWRY